MRVTAGIVLAVVLCGGMVSQALCGQVCPSKPQPHHPPETGHEQHHGGRHAAMPAPESAVENAGRCGMLAEADARPAAPAQKTSLQAASAVSAHQAAVAILPAVSTPSADSPSPPGLAARGAPLILRI